MSDLDLAREVQRFREKLLDLSNRNPLLNYRKSARRTITIVDELPDLIFARLVEQGKSFHFAPAAEEPALAESRSAEAEIPASAEPAAAGGPLPPEAAGAVLAADPPPPAAPATANAAGAPVDVPVESTEPAADPPAAAAGPPSAGPPSAELPVPPEDAGRLAKRHRDDRLQTALAESKLDAALNHIRREATRAIEETGVNYLFLALGMLGWREKPGAAEQLAPLILIPIRIERAFDARLGKYSYSIAYSGEELQDNLSLAKRLQRDFGLQLPAYDSELPPEHYFEAIAAAVEPLGDWRVRREALVGFFAFQKLLMYLDSDPAPWQERGGLSEHTIAGQVILGQHVDAQEGPQLYASDYVIDDSAEAAAIPLVDNTDSSQHSALVDIRTGRNLVIEGPPGTGKSQTITGAIAMALASGQRVLFVAEKLAALKVVSERLAKMGLGPFCLELHSDASSPRKVYDALRERLDAAFAAPRDLQSVARDLAQRRAELAAYLEHSRVPTGPYAEPLYEAMWRAIDLRGQGAASLREFAVDPELDRATCDRSAELLQAFAAAWAEIDEPQRTPWRGLWAHRLNPRDLREVEQALDRLAAAAAAARREADSLTQQFGPDSLPWLAGGAAPLGVRTGQIAELRAAAAELRGGAPVALLADAEVRGQARQLAQAVATARQLGDEAASYLRDDSGAGLAAAHALQQAIADSGLPADLPRAELATLAARLRTLGELLERSAVLGQQLAAQDIAAPSTLREFERGEYLYRLVRHPIVAARTTLPPGLFLATAVRACREARQQCDRLLAERQQLQEAFHWPSVPAVDEVGEIARQLRPHVRSWFRWLQRDYRSAKRRLGQFWGSGIGGRPLEWLAWLERLESFQRAADEFAAREDVPAAVGELFAGFDTDWQQVETLLNWRTTAEQKGLDRQRAEALLARRDPQGPRPAEVVACREALQQELAAPRLAEWLGLGGDVPGEPFETLRARVERLQSLLEQIELNSKSFRLADGATLGEVVRQAQVVEQAEQARAAVDRAATWAELGGWYAGPDTDAAALVAHADWLDRLAALGTPPTAIAAWCAGPLAAQADQLHARAAALTAEHEAWTAARAALAGCGEADEDWLPLFAAEARSVAGVEHAAQLRAALDQLPAWAGLCRLKRQAEEAGLGLFTDACLAEAISPAQLAASYRLTVWEAAAERQVAASGVLQQFSRQRHEQIRQQFQQLDRQWFQLNRRQVASEAAGHEVPEGNARGRVADKTELALICHETKKQRSHLRIRELLSLHRAGRAVQALKPCFMMSPLSVAQFLAPDGIDFDLVIMDEASQIKPEDALGTLLRAKQLVVVGDPKQLPPTSFFDRISDDVEEETATQFDNSESILEVAMKSFQPVRRLRWHYRSQHESLIHFSNDRFYDGDLIVFPSPVSDPQELGVSHQYVPDASFQSGANVVEAQAVAAAIVRHAQTRPHESLGVGTFNMKHSEVIADALDRLCQEDAAAREAVDRLNAHPEPLFVKNLENLQGDERDVIFIAYTYGPDPHSGRVMNRFGPLTLEHGWRRLNVLVTRARKRVVVFSSLQPSDILGGPDRSRGVNAMKDYLSFSQTGKLPDRGSLAGGEPQSPFEEAVARVVRQMGLDVVPQVGVAGYFIDLGVLRPGSAGDFLLGIECDGATYHSSRSARDRDRLREEVICSRGWRLHRIWSTDWFTNAAHEERRLRDALSAVWRA